MKLILWGIVLYIIFPVLILPFAYYLHMHPYGYSNFDREKWIAEEGEDGKRCDMAGTVAEDVLKPSMTRTEIEQLVGPLSGPRYTQSGGSKIYFYYLGWCSPIAWDPYSLYLEFDEKDHLIKAYNVQN